MGILNPKTTNIIQIISNHEVGFNYKLDNSQSQISNYDCNH